MYVEVPYNERHGKVANLKLQTVHANCTLTMRQTEDAIAKLF